MLLLLLFGTHLYFTFRLGIIQRKLPLGIRLSLTRDVSQPLTGNGVSPYSALATALAATIGTGNIIGISTAIDRRSGSSILVLADRLSWYCNLLRRELSFHALQSAGRRWTGWKAVRCMCWSGDWDKSGWQFFFLSLPYWHRLVLGAVCRHIRSVRRWRSLPLFRRM